MDTSVKNRLYTVVGATSTVGSAIVERLTAAGHRVRPVSRAAGVSLDDAPALRDAFAGADGAFVMIPFDWAASDLHEREREIGEKLADAVRAANVRRVILLSGLNAPLKKGTSLGAALMEDRLNALAIPELLHLRAGFFMENFQKGLAFAAQAESGSFATPFRGDRPMPMIASRDVGAVAAELLTATSFPASKVRELHGAGDYTLAQTTAILGKALGKPNVEYVQVPLDAARAGMLETGMSTSFADAVIETARSFNDEERWAAETRNAGNTTPTTLEQWAREAFGGAA